MHYPNPMFRTRLSPRSWHPLLICALLLIGVGCAGPTPQSQTAAGNVAAIQAQADEPGVSAPAPVADSSTPPPRQAPPMSTPLPPEKVPDRSSVDAPGTVSAGTQVRIDTACARDADCVVKDVGNCCGYYPACVNVNSPTDPAAVQAQCAREGTMSICGFPSISGCQCVAGQCQAEASGVER